MTTGGEGTGTEAQAGSRDEWSRDRVRAPGRRAPRGRAFHLSGARVIVVHEDADSCFAHQESRFPMMTLSTEQRWRANEQRWRGGAAGLEATRNLYAVLERSS